MIDFDQKLLKFIYIFFYLMNQFLTTKYSFSSIHSKSTFEQRIIFIFINEIILKKVAIHLYQSHSVLLTDLLGLYQALIIPKRRTGRIVFGIVSQGSLEQHFFNYKSILGKISLL